MADAYFWDSQFFLLLKGRVSLKKQVVDDNNWRVENVYVEVFDIMSRETEP